MFSRLRARLTYANVLSTLALFVALGGSSYAAVQLANNSVRSKHIKNRQVKKADIARNAVNAQKVQNRTLRAEDFAPGQLQPGPRGPRGFQGPRGLPAQTASSGFKSITAATGAGTTVPLLTVGPITYSANCLDQGGGQFRLEVRAASSQAGAVVAVPAGNTAVGGTPTMIWFEFGTTPELTSQRHQVVVPSGHTHRAAVVLGTHRPGANCLARVDVDA
jgi:hypothetical protein